VFLGAVVLAWSFGHLAVPAQALSSQVFFRTPSGNIGCAFSPGAHASLGCRIASGLVPRPGHGPACTQHSPWADGYEMGPTRGPRLDWCDGNPVVLHPSRLLAYGTTWRRAGFTCWSRRTGLTCKNRSGHGWLLSRAHSYGF